LELYKVRDIVRENVGRDKLSLHMLNFALEQGLRRIEKAGNFYWMRGTKTWSCVIDQQGYNITNSTSGGLNLPNFKDTRILLVSDQTLTNPDWDEVFGPEDIEEIGLEFADTDTGMPVVFTMDEDTITGTLEDPTGTTVPKILLWPNKPDKTYSMRLHYFQWTSLPTDVTTDNHEVLVRWPEALIYAATGEGILAAMKDPQLATYWFNRFDNPSNRMDPGELTKIKRYSQERMQSSRIEMRPMRGSLMSRRNRWRNNREIWI
jgi:hypothetical protein